MILNFFESLFGVAGFAMFVLSIIRSIQGDHVFGGIDLGIGLACFAHLRISIMQRKGRSES